ncbi:hypothetical protein GGTG_14161 [Gaeumannomyces tritici R3-111a-1]|uniref:Asl1-like glycosyl hydrolase catalytic domain-containing protein n=1 Tax=Gaeumannomyces tritici (strain R3-111a-1) TaxID=644352 RepID=J3PKU3_GAET3|nr:hypothetical protein GGTG_14161 [Gaeumannomyces tritici R3-111a-1]EJT68258.1 hypothetical protein GGTG_14161 [Gaeumannomyces tritici R3-111a-1]
MLRKMQLFASALLASEAAALVAHHRHGHQPYKRDLVYAHTEVVVETTWVTKTVYDDDPVPTTTPSVFKAAVPAKPTTSSSSVAPAPPPPPPAPPAPTTAAAPSPSPSPPPPPAQVQIENKPEAVKAPEPKSSAPAPPPPPPPPPPPASAPTPATPTPQPPAKPTEPNTGNSNSGSSSPAPATGGNKRGLSYNEASLTAPFLGSGNKLSWAYNWGQRPDGLSAAGIDYVPMLWGPIDMHTNTWKKNAEDALNKGAKSLLSFNECDFPSQCNKSPAEAAAAHIQWMNPYASRASISSPSITNSNIAGQGLDWLRAWVQACNGQCKFDFCAAHWYSPPNPADLLGHLDKVHEICQGKPVWLTEFAPISGDKAKFLADVMKELDTNPKYSYVQRYAYFMVGVGDDKLMSSASALNTVGQTFAYQ